MSLLKSNSVLSVEKCRKILEEGDGIKNLSDEEVRRIRDSLYELGEIIFDDYIEKLKEENPRGKGNK